MVMRGDRPFFVCLALLPLLQQCLRASNVEVTYGSTIKLQHKQTKFRLHSHDIPYGTGSHQQSVTGFPNGIDSNSYWIIAKSQSNSTSLQGDIIRDGTIIRLQHMRTHKWLHSHLHQSPLSKNHEISAFGGDDESDTGDNWRLEIEGKGNIWMKDQMMRLQHVDTGVYLHSHDLKYEQAVTGQQEVCGVIRKSSESIWLAAEGVYIPHK